MKPLDMRFGSDTVQDNIKTMSDYLAQALATAALIATCDLRAVAADIDVEKAKPLDHGPNYDEPDKEAVILLGHA